MQNNNTARRVIKSGELPPVSGVSVLGGEKTPRREQEKGQAEHDRTWGEGVSGETSTTVCAENGMRRVCT